MGTDIMGVSEGKWTDKAQFRFGLQEGEKALDMQTRWNKVRQEYEKDRPIQEALTLVRVSQQWQENGGVRITLQPAADHDLIRYYLAVRLVEDLPLQLPQIYHILPI